MERRAGIADMLRGLPLAHQVMIGIAGAVLAMAAFVFFQWVSTPSYTVLYSGLDDQSLATVVEELERLGVPYELTGGGSQVMVPRSQVYQARADLASAGVRSGSGPMGYELLDGQGLNVSDFRQRVDYQRALEGELEKTLLAMRDISTATVHLVIPEETLFLADEEAVTASVLISTGSPLGELQVETITFLVASSVEGLEAKDVTVADTDGNVLHAAGQIAATGAVSNRNLRMTNDYEAALANDVRRLLDTVVAPGTASVVVRAELNFNEESTETESYDPTTAVALREQTIDETYSGAGTPPGGTLGVDGEEVPVVEAGEGYTYDRSEVIREYGIDRVVTHSVVAPGQVEQLSVAVVMDDGSLTGFPVPPVNEIEALITAAVGLDAARGDSISVSAVAFPPAAEIVEEESAAAAAPMDIMSMIPQLIGGLVLLIVAIALMLMSRGGKKSKGSKDGEVPTPAALPAGLPERQLVGAGVGGAGGNLHPEVMNLVQKQPEEIAVLLRSWLADRR